MQYTDLEKAYELCEKILQTINSTLYPPVDHVICSFGVTCHQKNDNISSMLKMADECLYIAKERGKNGIVSSPN